jgi:pimeloyl-ACP methyl ester carboxylesterase
MGRGGATDRQEPACRLVRFAATDGVELAGLLYEPAKSSQRAILFLHGTGGASIFDSKRTNPLGDEFTKRGLAWFPFNNRGAHVQRRLRRKGRSIAGGSAHELIRECVPDIDGAIAELRRRGYRDLTLIGHSTGANKVAVYDHYKSRNPIRRYVLLGGGDDTGLAWEALGSRRFHLSFERARQMIAARRGNELAPKPVAGQTLSWRSLHDMLNPDGDYNVFPFLEAMRGPRLGRKPLFRYLKGIAKPSLVLYGSADEYCYGDVDGCVSELADVLAAKRNFELAIIDGADHGFSGMEAGLASIIAEWIG